eukprot:scaffold12183_cov68-Phaeocystis_antarctica.AAC.12
MRPYGGSSQRCVGRCHVNRRRDCLVVIDSETEEGLVGHFEIEERLQEDDEERREETYHHVHVNERGIRDARQLPGDDVLEGNHREESRERDGTAVGELVGAERIRYEARTCDNEERQ